MSLKCSVWSIAAIIADEQTKQPKLVNEVCLISSNRLVWRVQEDSSAATNERRLSKKHKSEDEDVPSKQLLKQYKLALRRKFGDAVLCDEEKFNPSQYVITWVRNATCRENFRYFWSGVIPGVSLPFPKDDTTQQSLPLAA